MSRFRFALGLVSAALVVAVFAQSLLLTGIRVYQRVGAPMASRLGMTCRFEPSCSQYAEIVISRDGVVRGGWQALTRVARCRPGTPHGTVDRP